MCSATLSFVASRLLFPALLVVLSLPLGCGGSVDEWGSGSGGVSSGGTGAEFAGGSGGAGTGAAGSGGSGGTGGAPYVEPACPDVDSEPEPPECDPLDPLVGCSAGMGCYPYFDYPEGDCGAPTFGAYCAYADTGEQGDFCGGTLGYCAPGYMCVVGAAGGARCVKICALDGSTECPAGLICGETDVRGYGVCY